MSTARAYVDFYTPQGYWAFRRYFDGEEMTYEWGHTGYWNRIEIVQALLGADCWVTGTNFERLRGNDAWELIWEGRWTYQLPPLPSRNEEQLQW